MLVSNKITYRRMFADATALPVPCAERLHSHVGPFDNTNLWTLSVLNFIIKMSFALAIN